MKKLIIELVNKQRAKWREERFNTFLKTINIQKGATILDLGGHDGSFFYNFKNKIEHLDLKIIVADIDIKALEIAKSRGFDIVLISENEKLPIDDKSVDIVFSNSVIEHVTIPYNEVWDCVDEKVFQGKSYINQKKFADEIMRVGKGYFVQTPHPKFIVEVHSWLPFVTLLKRENFIRVLKFTNKFWIVKSAPACNLLDEKQMKNLFFNADNIYVKNALGFKKETIAYKK